MKFEEREVWVKTASVLLEDLMHALCPLCIKVNMDGSASCSECSHSLRVKELRPKIVLQKDDLAKGVPVPRDAVPGCVPYGAKCHAKKGHIGIIDDLYAEEEADGRKELISRVEDTEDDVDDLDREVHGLRRELSSLVRTLDCPDCQCMRRLPKDLDALAKRVAVLETICSKPCAAAYIESDTPTVSGSQVPSWDIRQVLERMKDVESDVADIDRVIDGQDKRLTRLFDRVATLFTFHKEICSEVAEVKKWPYTFPVKAAVILPTWTPPDTGTPLPQDADKGTGSPPPRQPGSVCEK